MRSATWSLALAASLLVWAGRAAGQQEATLRLRDCAKCPEMVAVPAGRFRMGVADDEEEAEQLADEFRHRSLPLRIVHISPVLIGRFEVTVAQYREFARQTERAEGDGCFVWSGDRHALDGALSWQRPGFAQDDDHPVTCVSWQDAVDYTRWLSQHTGKRYRLPSEAEWEYAARSGARTYRFWGSDPDSACAYANGADRSTRAAVPGAVQWPAHACDDGFPQTAPVGRFRPNAFGLHDMLGNVAEWTADCWNPDYRGGPDSGSARTDGDCAMRVVRGGAWDEGPAGLRSAYRVGSPVVIRVYARGFRVARDP